MKLSIIIPVYNEKETIKEIIQRVREAKIPYQKEIIIVDDNSSDGTRELLKNIQEKDKNIKLLFHKKNFGKGKSVSDGLKLVSGELVLIQDADLEYNPEDYPSLLKPILEGKTDVVYGSRWRGTSQFRKNTFYFGNQFLTFLTRILYPQKITDMLCGYKVFKSHILKSLSLQAQRFEICPEITAKLTKRGYKIYEVPIHYNPRTKKEGKKIKWWDGVVVVVTLFKYHFNWGKIFTFLVIFWGFFVTLKYFLMLSCEINLCFPWR